MCTYTTFGCVKHALFSPPKSCVYKIAFASQVTVVYKGSNHVLCTYEGPVEVVLLKENMSDNVGSRRVVVVSGRL